MIKEHKFPYESFIGGWYIPETICDNLIDYFKQHKHQARNGLIYNPLDNDSPKIVDVNTKDSLDLSFNIDKLKNIKVLRQYILTVNKVLELYQNKYEYVRENALFDIIENVNIQYYKSKGGFKKWHFERASDNFSNRLLVFMTYLNDVDDGGTDFYYQKISSPAKKGLTLIWPAEWTHTHKGQVSQKEKYIITGWYNYLRGNNEF